MLNPLDCYLVIPAVYLDLAVPPAFPAHLTPRPRLRPLTMADQPIEESSTPAKKITDFPGTLHPHSNSGPRSPPPPGLKMASPSPHSGHRASFAENMRGTPHSPRASRQPSLTQQALQELLNNPPTKGGNSDFHGRDWKTIRVGEIVDRSKVRYANYDTNVEEATQVR